MPWRNEKRLTLFFSVIVTAMWAVSLIADIMLKDYAMPAAVHSVMILVAGGIFGKGVANARQQATTEMTNNEQQRQQQRHDDAERRKSVER